jgi:FHS family L-fucose permease-like MFS transporter
MTKQNRSLVVAFVTVTTLFFAWGFITQTIDPLIASVRAIFRLSYTEALLTQFAFFMAYGIVSLPGAALVSKVGYGRAIVFALLTMIAGCLVIPLATHLGTYELVLVALFIIASGITVLQVSANPLAAALGRPERSHLRLLLSQTFNSLGTVIAPWLGSHIMLRGALFGAEGAAEDAASRAQSLRDIDTAFLVIVVMIALLTLLMVRFRKAMESAAPTLVEGPKTSVLTALSSRWAVFGALAIFLYVGAEVAIGSVLTNFLHGEVSGDNALLRYLVRGGAAGQATLEEAGKMVSFYWGGAFVGRIIGSALLVRFRAWKLLAINAAVAAVLCFLVSQSGGDVSAYAALIIGLFNSIMFPVIFTLTLERSTASQAATSGLLCMAIVGGAIVPLLVGAVADAAGLHMSFLVPMVAYLAIATFALSARKARLVVRERAAAIAGH